MFWTSQRWRKILMNCSASSFPAKARIFRNVRTKFFRRAYSIQEIPVYLPRASIISSR